MVEIDSLAVLQADAGDNLLAILNEKKLLSKSACRNGNCRICRCRLLLGDIDYQNKTPIALSEQDIQEGWILPCISIIVSDIKITDLNN